MPHSPPTVVRALAALTTAMGLETGAAHSTPSFANQLVVALVLTAKGGTTPMLDVDVEWSLDGGTTWVPAETLDSFTQLADPAVPSGVLKVFAVKGPLFRLMSTVSGASGTITFSATDYSTG